MVVIDVGYVLCTVSLFSFDFFLSLLLSLSLSLFVQVMKLTTDLINESPSHINPLKDRELVLRGGWKNNSNASVTAQSHMMVLQI